MAYNDVKIDILTQPTFTFGLLNKSIIVTGEAEIPVKRLANLEDLQTYLADLGVTAPILENQVNIFLSQVDVSGNSVKPEYFYVMGKPTVAEIPQALIDASQISEGHDFYAVLVIPGSDTALNEFLPGYANQYNKLVFRDYEDKANEPGELEVGPRVAMIYGDIQVNDMAIAWAGRTIAKGAGNTKFKDRTLTGVTSSTLTSAEVDLLNENGVNCYIYKYGAPQTDGSICSDKETHIDEIWTRDTIVINMRQALHDLMRTSETLPFDYNGMAKVEAVINDVMITVGNNGMLAEDPKGNYEFGVIMPEITGPMRDTRVLSNVKFWYIPSGAIEKIEITGYELFETPTTEVI
jgi:hypothetical protein